MKTTTYNPSPLEVDFANALLTIREQIEGRLHNQKVTKVQSHLGKDNPMIRFNMLDNDGDPHEIVVRIVQIPDKF